MLPLLALVITAFAAMLLLAGTDTGALGHLPTVAIAVSVTGALLALYLATLRHGGDETGNPRLRLIAGLFIAALIGIGYYGYGPSIGLTKMIADSLPGGAPSADRQHNQSAAVRIRRSADGRIVAQGRVNNAAINLLIDSGSTAVVLKSSDAEKAGIDVKSAAFDTPIATAGGETMVAPVRVNSLEVGPIQLTDLEAFVAKPGTINESLLGMSFLRRLSSYELSGDFATLRQ